MTMRAGFVLFITEQHRGAWHHLQPVLGRQPVSMPNAASLIGAENPLPHAYTCPQAVRTAVPADFHSANSLAERARAFITDQKDDDRPFFLLVSWPDPQRPFNPPGMYWDM